jgi:glycolate oxidase FAD binding subunit
MSAPTRFLEARYGPLVGGRARAATAADAVAGVRPGVVVEPGDEDEVARVLRAADDGGLKVLVRGGGTQLGLGFPPAGGDLLLSLARLDQVIEYNPFDLTVSVQAGISLVAVQRALAEHRQVLALDPPLPAAATIGGIIATNASGPRRLRYGGVRDQIIGVRVVTPDGTIARGGGKVVKNVAGYDLPKLFTGSLGTLGVIVAATFRVHPLRPDSLTVTLAAPDPAPLCALAVRVIGSTLEPTMMELWAPSPAAAGEGSAGAVGEGSAGGCALAVRFQSVTPAIAGEAEQLVALAGELGGTARTLRGDEEARLWERLGADLTIGPAQRATRRGEGEEGSRRADGDLSPGDGRPPDAPTAAGEGEAGTSPPGALSRGESGSGALVVKASVLPTEVADWLAALRRVADEAELDAGYHAYPGHGIVFARLAGAEPVLAGAVAPLRAAAAAGRGRGSLVVWDAPPALAGQVDVWGPSPALEVMRRVKAQFDPRATLNPGRFLGRM